jgi:ribose-phosphate pyrophosphokinase
MFKLFSGTANQKLSEEVAKLLKLPLSKAEVVRFGNSEVRVTIQEKVKNNYCVVLQPSSNPTDTNLMELFFFCDSLKRQEAKKIIGVIPYFGYAKQNIQHRPGECVSANVVIRFLEAIGFNKIYTFDIHAEATGGVFFIPFKNLSAFPLLAKKLSDYFDRIKTNKKEIVFVSPDQGAVEKVRTFGRYFYETDNFSQAVIEKQRNLNIKHQTKPLGLYGNIKNKIAVIVDDMVVSGSTLLPAIDLCLRMGTKEVYAAVVHHDFTKEAPKKLQTSRLIKFFSTNTIALSEEQKFPKLKEFSVAPIIANELKNI